MQRKLGFSAAYGRFCMLPVEARGEYRAVGGAYLRGNLYVAGQLRRDTEIGDVSLRALFEPDGLPDALNLAVALLAVGLRFAAVILGAYFNEVIAGLPDAGYVQFKISVAALMTAGLGIVDENVRAVIDGAEAEKDAFAGFKTNCSAIPADAGDVLFDLGQRACP